MFVPEPEPGLRKRIIQGRPPDPSRPHQIRECPTHGTEAFHQYGQGRSARWRCRRCVAEAVTRRHRKLRAILIAEAGGECRVCGYHRLASNLHFHHVNPEEKSFAMTMARGKSEAAYRAEAAKCVLVCANCHGEIEAGLVPCPPLLVQRDQAA